MNEPLFDLLPDYSEARFPPPRTFQDPAIDSIIAGRRAGHRVQMLCAPTGAGKSYLGLKLCHAALKTGRKATFVCDRKSLINQTSAVASAYGLHQHGIIQAQNPRFNMDLPFQIASVQTVMERGWHDTHLIIIDEAHTLYQSMVEHVKTTKATVIGLSATPFSRGLGQVFTNLINAATMHELTESGELVPLRVMSCTRINMDGARTSDGEWTDKAAAERGMEIVGDVVSEWTRYAESRKTIVFGSNVRHCEELCRQFNECGVMAEVFTHATKDNERERILSEFSRPDSAIRVLISVEALAKGFDVKDVGCVVDCRPLRKSLSTAIQMWGRGLRASKETGKTDCLLLDHSGNIVRFIEDFTHFFYHGLDSLDEGEKLDRSVRKDVSERETLSCPKCGYKPFFRRCMSCGHETAPQAAVAALPGQMQEIFIGKSRVAANERDLWVQLCSYANSSNSKNPRGRAWHLFRNISGHEPPRSFPFSTDAVNVDPAIIRKIKSLDIAFMKARSAA
ncbi:DEAD/DEAH box helicase [Paraburkholderia kururiensis]|uniref:DEAD/DEAH box helicase family protein n=1 Tax=Paraburkholderia kururiensis TaxID=984307 RepID=A0ABZ0WSQ1_9BURK|nr:DEAD/DEAH box helicase family protein [Paraburkholderia kururiensis]WQD80269.1 DEAD/DEAH box helicase family protein [Paraburkholderia kururiensis]